MTIRLAYFGTPALSADFLEKILLDKNLPIEVITVVTQPDKPFGREHIIIPSHVKRIAQKYNIDVKDNISGLSDTLKMIDLAVVFAYGEIIKKDLLRAPKYGSWNIHPSLLPKYRGASPITYPLILGDEKTGVTLMQMDQEMDHGDIIDQQELTIKQNDIKAHLETKILDASYALFKKNLLILAQEGSSEIENRPQDHQKATYTQLLNKNDGYIELDIIKKALNGNDLNADELPRITRDYLKRNHLSLSESPLAVLNAQQIIYNLYKGLYPWPGVWTKILINKQEKRLKITQLSLKDGQLFIEKVQLEGKNEVSFQQFNTAYSIF